MASLKPALLWPRKLCRTDEISAGTSSGIWPLGEKGKDIPRPGTEHGQRYGDEEEGTRPEGQVGKRIGVNLQRG